jgi:ketosteroid isomerase-like protein
MAYRRRGGRLPTHAGHIMNDLEKLLAIEEIKQLKARYCRAIDEKHLQEWRNVFSDDAVILAPEVQERPKIVGIEAILEFVGSALEGATRVHHLHAPEIAVANDSEATGIWAMEDNLYWVDGTPNMFGARRHFRGFGHYHEKYRKASAGWRITEMALVRLYMERDGVRFPA